MVGQQADIWSMGIILFTILYGRYPFNSNDADYPRQVVDAQYTLPQDVNVCACSHWAGSLAVSHMTQLHPAEQQGPAFGQHSQACWSCKLFMLVHLSLCGCGRGCGCACKRTCVHHHLGFATGARSVSL